MRRGVNELVADNVFFDPTGLAMIVTGTAIFPSGMVPPQCGHECRLATGRNAGALFMPKNGVHGLRAHRRRGAAGLVAAYEPAARRDRYMQLSKIKVAGLLPPRFLKVCLRNLSFDDQN